MSGSFAYSITLNTLVMLNHVVTDINAYYFKHNGMCLAPVYAHTEKEARSILITQHIWCNAPYNSTLIKVEKGTEYDRILAS